MFLNCAASDNAFMTGIAIRIIGFFNFSLKLDYITNSYELFIDELKKYITNCADFHDRISKQEGYFIKENFTAVKRAIKEINSFLCMNDIAVKSNNIHFVF